MLVSVLLLMVVSMESVELQLLPLQQLPQHQPPQPPLARLALLQPQLPQPPPRPLPPPPPSLALLQASLVGMPLLVQLAALSVVEEQPALSYLAAALIVPNFYVLRLRFNIP